MARDRLGEAFPSVLSAAQAGAPWALERLWRTYAPVVSGYARVQGAVEPDDITSEVFLGAFRSIGEFNGEEAGFRSWLFTIAHRRILDARRAAARRPQLQPLEDATEPQRPGDTEVDVLGKLATERVRRLCERLVPDQRDVLLLRLVAGMTVEEVATTLAKTPGAVKALQRRGLGALQKILEREGVPL